MKKNNNKGFTLMEMLIVVAIIAVLVAIAIPVFTNQLEKAREATDEANIRSAYAEVMACAMTDANSGTNGVKKTENAGSNSYAKYVAAVQTQSGWQSGTEINIAGIDVSAQTANKGNTTTPGWVITYTEGATEPVTIVAGTDTTINS